MADLHYDEMHVPEPDLDALRQHVAALQQQARDASSADDLAHVLERWDDAQRDIDTWASLTAARYRQDTEDEARKAARDRLDTMTAPLTELEVDVLRSVLESPLGDDVATRYELRSHADRDSPYWTQRWGAKIASYAPEIEDDVTREQALSSEYTALLASARVDVDGESLSFTEAGRYLSSPDRDVRTDVARKMYDWLDEHADELDRIFDELVELRTRIARTLGHETFTPVGYLRMRRVGYGPDDVARFREEVLEHVVPVARQLRERQADVLGLSELAQWDESIWTADEDPSPPDDLDAVLDGLQSVFDGVHAELGEFFRTLRERGLIDLGARKGKAGGGFCTYLPRWKMPFIFGNFSGTRHGVKTIVHEVGHAFQKYVSRDLPLLAQSRPTFESAEIHSMSLEFLVWPYMDAVFGSETATWKRIHLSERLCFLPYGVAVDLFQHEVYAHPDATPDDRAAMWQKIEETYLPWRDYRGLPFPTSGRFWQRQRHIYRSPFYYIDYVLAQTCALQFWARSREDYGGAVDDYVALCRRGGTAAFATLAESAGLTSPFERGCLTDVVAEARASLDL